MEHDAMAQPLACQRRSLLLLLVVRNTGTLEQLPRVTMRIDEGTASWPYIYSQ
jgi:hypothetical protein